VTTDRAADGAGGDRWAGRVARHHALWGAAALMLGVAAVVVTLFFQHLNANALTAQKQLASIEQQLNRQDALEWRAISGLVSLSELGAELSESREQASDSLAQAQDFGLTPETVGALRGLQEKYATAVDDELALLAAGERSKAIEFDKTTVDPAFSAIGPVLRAADEELAASAQQAGRISSAGVVGTVILALAGVWLVERRRQEVRRRIERRSDARYRALVDRSHDLVLVLGPQQQLVYVSPTAERALGLAPPSGQLLDLMHPEDRDIAAQLLHREKVREHETVESAQLRLRHVDLGWRICEVSVTDLRRDGAEEFMVVVHDVTERARAEEAVAEARDQALEASRQKSAFLATMSHEIRTPMNGVIGLTGLLLDTRLDDRQCQYAEGIRGAGEALLAIINDILDFSKIEAGKLELEVVDFDLVQVVDEAAGLVAQAAQRKGLELVAYCYPGLPTELRGDPARIRQVLLNLASNAVKFTQRGEVVIRARPVEESDGAVVVRFEVADTGIGIAKADHQRLFEPFSQADTSTTRRFGGTGLGLAISRQLVAAMDGELGLDSALGRGSTFWFTLPLARAAAGAVDGFRPFHHLLEGLRVLVVDDNDTNRLILREQLSAWDVHAEVAEDGPTALDRLRTAAGRNQPHDLALLDMCMAGMDGLELAQRISADPALATTRLVLLTSAADVGADETRQAGIVASLTKPVRASQLYDCLMRLTASTAHDGQQAAAVASALKPTLRGHILVVEDNTTNQMVALGILDQLGYRADVAANGLEALEALDRTQYAAVLMDCQMPEMDGYTATGEIRRREAGSRHIPVIAMTAGAMEGDRERCMAAGMDDYVSKPVKPHDIAAALARWVAREQEPTRQHQEGTPVTLAEMIDTDRLEMLRHLRPADPSLVSRLVEGFLADAPATLNALRTAADARNSAELASNAHRLKGAAVTLGVPAVGALCERIEAMGEAGQVDGAPQLLDRLEAELCRVAKPLRAVAGPVPK